ncbi:ubiquitin carboxyl-terminal hydrolase 24-like isoform X1 [Rhododendron vialii]|uniref:ubiquitin carboxyl-terminal hydrolase 24-like isoform X1 n=1 Tax=Rhododendron vialii TaxID=182163 RepID=UPI00265FA23F|nr:ubiquitin carboxyl-terminal hydrolase 24-like isoform X1 [Rhododendron vialii]
MTDHKVLIFGSFTEDEIKSLQRQSPKTDIEIKFGSIDSETLKSVGIFSTKLSEVNHTAGCISKLVNKKNAATCSTVESTAPIAGTTIDENGSVHHRCSVSCSDGIQGLKIANVELTHSCFSENVSNFSKEFSGEHHFGEIVTIPSNLIANEALVSSSEGVDLVNSRESILETSNGRTAAVRNLLPRGLVNMGNLCFLNATLQALLSCPPFVLLLQELRTRDIPMDEYPALRAFVEFISDFDTPMESSSKKKEMFLETGKPFRPDMFETILKIFTPDVPNSIHGRPRQEDAQEFLSFIMHQMHDELLKLEGQISICNGERTSLVSSINDDDDDDCWETVGPKNKTAITRTQSFIPSKLSVIFGGQLRSVVKARAGSKASATVQPFLLLHLNICPDPVCTIEDALHLFSAPETLEGYRTSAPGKAEVVNASKSVKILELSEIMILHLMRFSYGSQGSTKLHKPVRFPLELVFGREIIVSPSSEGRRYELVATITHHGRDPSKGHYTADTRHPNGKWLHFDDASVTVIPTSKVLHEQAYVLFYKQL